MKRLILIILSLIFLSGCVTFGKPKPMTSEDYQRLATETLDAKVSALAETTDIQPTDLFYIIDGSTSKKITGANVFDLIDTSAELLGILGDETGTGVAVFGTAPTFTTSITIGDAGINETELEILDGASLTTTQLNYLNQATGTTGTATTNLVFSDAPTITSPILSSSAIVRGLTGAAAELYLISDAAEDNADNWRVAVADSSDFTIENSESGSYATLFTLTNTGTVVATNIDGSGTISANLFTPDAADGADIGTADLEFSDIYLADESYIYFGDDSDVSLGHVQDIGLLMEENDKLMFGDALVYIFSDDDGYLDLGADTQIRLNAPVMVTDGIIPDSPGGGSLGSTSAEFTNIYITDSGIIYGQADSTNLLESSATGWTANLLFTATAGFATSGGTITPTEWGYLEDVTESVQDAINGIDTTFGTSLQANHLVNTAGVLNLTAEVALHDEANTWTAVQTFGELALSPLDAAPDPIVNGRVYYANNSDWDPCDVGGTVNYYLVYDGAAWVALFDEDGVWLVSSIYTTTLIATTLNDTTNPHDVTSAEMKSKYISNVSGAMHLDIVADELGWGTIFIIGSANDLVVHPADSQTWYLNGVAGAADQQIANTADTIGESMTCISTTLTAGTGVLCESRYANFAWAAE